MKFFLQKNFSPWSRGYQIFQNFRWGFLGYIPLFGLTGSFIMYVFDWLVCIPCKTMNFDLQVCHTIVYTKPIVDDLGEFGKGHSFGCQCTPRLCPIFCPYHSFPTLWCVTSAMVFSLWPDPNRPESHTVCPTWSHCIRADICFWQSRATVRSHWVGS